MLNGKFRIANRTSRFQGNSQLFSTREKKPARERVSGIDHNQPAAAHKSSAGAAGGGVFVAAGAGRVMGMTLPGTASTGD